MSRQDMRRFSPSNTFHAVALLRAEFTAVFLLTNRAAALILSSPAVFKFRLNICSANDKGRPDSAVPTASEFNSVQTSFLKIKQHKSIRHWAVTNARVHHQLPSSPNLLDQLLYTRQVLLLRPPHLLLQKLFHPFILIQRIVL